MALGSRGPDDTLWVRRGRSTYAATVVERFDAWSLRDDVHRTVTTALDDAGIGHLTLPAVGGEPHRVVVAAKDADRLTAALCAAPEAARLNVAAIRRGGRRGPSSPLTRLDSTGPGSVVRIHTFQVSESGRPLHTSDLGVELEVWHELADDEASPDGGILPAGTLIAPRPNPRVTRLAPGRLADPPPSASATALGQVTFPVDAVYTWVDSTDPGWQARYAAALPDHAASDLNVTAHSESRFSSRDELRFSLRSVAAYAGWVRRIHIVTDGQIPEWLDTSHPDINLVRHRDIFPDPSDLPTFNSHAIEATLHRIDGLADHYIYLNDDVFLGRPVRPETFFTAGGDVRYFPSMVPVDDDPVSVDDIPIVAAFKNGREILEARFGARPLTRLRHSPHAQRRDVLEELERALPNEFRQTRSSRFRGPKDVSVAAFMQAYWAEATGRAVSSDLGYEFIDLSSPDADRIIDRLMTRGDVDAFCLNETHTDPEDADVVAERIRLVLTTLLPFVSPYER